MFLGKPSDSRSNHIGSKPTQKGDLFLEPLRQCTYLHLRDPEQLTDHSVTLPSATTSIALSTNTLSSSQGNGGQPSPPVSSKGMPNTPTGTATSASETINASQSMSTMTTVVLVRSSGLSSSTATTGIRKIMQTDP